MSRENMKVADWITLSVDLLSMCSAYLLSGFMRGGINEPGFFSGIYGNLLILLVLSVIVISSVGYNNRNIFKRGYFEEFKSIIRDQGKLALIVLGYMFVVQESGSYSRIFLVLFFIFNILITYVMRSYMKLFMLIGYKKSASSSKVMLITISDYASTIIRKIRREYEWQTYVTTVALWDVNWIGERIEGLEVVANKDNLLDVVRLNVVDEVFIHIPSNLNVDLEEMILEFEKMGIIVHINLDIFDNLSLKEKTVNEFAGHQVITFSTRLFDTKQAILKRFIDIIGGLVGCCITLLLTFFLAPAILIESRGPIFFSQTRVGKNGRRFRIYKFRSMYPDAEQRKKDLMEKNEMKGQMFKMTDDPRITKVGKFLRKTSLDEFPQFFNVLLGDMSLVGTRPPTEDEFFQYESWHRRRLSLKPGLTGLWQVSGRSNITNFEDVVKMDLKYIDTWSVSLDIKLLVKTVVVVLKGNGSR